MAGHISTVCTSRRREEGRGREVRARSSRRSFQICVIVIPDRGISICNNMIFYQGKNARNMRDPKKRKQRVNRVNVRCQFVPRSLCDMSDMSDSTDSHPRSIDRSLRRTWEDSFKEAARSHHLASFRSAFVRARSLDRFLAAPRARSIVIMTDRSRFDRKETSNCGVPTSNPPLPPSLPRRPR